MIISEEHEAESLSAEIQKDDVAPHDGASTLARVESLEPPELPQLSNALKGNEDPAAQAEPATVDDTPSLTSHVAPNSGSTLSLTDADQPAGYGHPEVLTGSESLADQAESALTDRAASLSFEESEAAIRDDEDIGTDSAASADLGTSSILSARPPRRTSTNRAPESFTEYGAAGLTGPTAGYRLWNQAIAEHLLLKAPAATDVYLTITPRILAKAIAEVNGTNLTPERRLCDAAAQKSASAL